MKKKWKKNEEMEKANIWKLLDIQRHKDKNKISCRNPNGSVENRKNILWSW